MWQGDSERLTAVLGVYPSDLLRALSRATGSDGPARAESLLNEARFSAALKRATEVEREFLAFVARLGGEVSPGAADWWLRHRRVAEPNAFVEGLAARGLLFYWPAGRPREWHDLTPEARGLHIAGKLWVPRVIGERAAAQCPVRPLRVTDCRPDAAPRDPWHIIRELFILSRYLTKRKPRMARASGGVGRNGWADLAHALDEEGTAADGGARLKWLVLLAVEAGIVGRSDERLVVTPRAAEFFESPPLGQRRALVEAAVRLREWNELDSPESLGLCTSAAATRGRSDVPSAGNRIRARRHVLRVLGQLAQPGRWHFLRELGERVMEAAPDFLVRRPPPPRDGYEPVYRGLTEATADDPAPISTRTGWALVEGTFVLRWVGGPLWWLGLVDINRQPSDRLFRLTDMGARVLSPADEEVDARPPARFFVQPNFEIAADGGGDNIGAIAQLSRVAELVSFDRAALLRITRESVLRALEGGLTREDIVRILSDGGRVAVPQNVSYSVGEWAAAHDRYELRTGVCVIETDETEELDALEQELPGCLERLGPTAARVLPDKAEAVAKALERRADVALIHHAEGVSRVFDLDEDMIATPVPERWYWYPEHLLEQIAERREVRSQRSEGRTANGNDTATVFRLTRESVQEGLARGLQATEIERFVEACATRVLTPSQRLLLRGWLGRYAPAQMASVTVLALPPEAVGDALAVPELREQITERLGPAIFAVRPQGRAKVKRLLERAGIAVEGEVTARGLTEEGPHPRSLSVPERAARHGVWGRRQWRSGDPQGARLELIEEAIEGGLRLEIEYQSVVKGEPPKRWVVGPQSLERSRWGVMRLHAFCYERETQRLFDVERMTEVQLVGQDEQDDGRIA